LTASSAEMASMSILDDAIREHLELKRAHGADESEVKRLEDEAFGPPGRPEEPDPMAEAPTEFMATPGAEAATEAPEESGRRINIADLQEAPPPEPAAEAPPVPAEDPVQAAPPAEEAPAAEHEAIAEAPDADGGHSTEERHAIADQPTEFFDVQAELGTEDTPPAEAPSPSDEEIAEVEAAEPKLAPVEPPTEIHATRAAPVEDVEEEEDEDFWSEQRLSDELDQALEAPLEEEDEPLEEAPRAAEPISEEHEQPAASAAPEASAEPEAGAEAEQPNYDPDTGHEDVLEDTPDFLEDAPEDDELWFEQRPPKDFDFDD
jgi:hypothetical protein